MPIVSECGRRGGGGGGGGGGGSGSSSFGRRGKRCVPAASSGSVSSARRGSDSRGLGVLQCGEVESDEEVQSSYRGPFDTMGALQDALPNKRKGGFRFYNGKTNSVVDVAQPAKGVANAVHPSPKKRKGFLPFGFSWTKPWSKGSRSRRGASATSISKNFRTTLSSALTGSGQGSSRGGGNEHQADSQDPARHCLRLHRRPNTPAVSASPPAAGALQAQRIAVQMRSVSVAGVEDVSESTASVQKRRRSLRY